MDLHHLQDVRQDVTPRQIVATKPRSDIYS
jgi:hypothetical protein